MSGSSTVRVLGPEDGEYAGTPGEHHDRFLIGAGETDGRFALVEIDFEGTGPIAERHGLVMG